MSAIRQAIRAFFISTVAVTVSCASGIKFSSDLSVIPWPREIRRADGYFPLDGDTRILVSEGMEEEAFPGWLANKIRRATGFEPPVEVMNESAVEDNSIAFVLDPEEREEEGYRLDVGENGVLVRASGAAGLFYGMQTLLQLMPVEIESNVPIPLEVWRVPCVQVRDRPRFVWRGMHLDVCRHFFPVAFIKKMLDEMARYKLNRFHWHLTEDQGWRIEIKKYPRLTTVGTWREETLVGRGLDKPHWFDGKRYGGYYTQEEVREVVRYARERFITVVPEIEMPGHSTAALAAYPGLSCTGGPFAVATHWGIFKDVYCAGKEETFRFLEDVLTEVASLFPGPYVHIGGDECPKDRWRECPDCQARIQGERLEDEDALQSYFVRRIETILNEAGKRLIGWDEILEGGLAADATVMSWRGMEGGIAAANQGHDVIMTPTSHCYFDYYQGRDGEPLAIGGYTPLEKVYSFDPVSAEIDEDRTHHVLGAQANVWTEFIETPRHVEYMVFPRLCALSEVVWTEADRKDEENFSARLGSHLRRLAIRDVNFRSP